MHDKGWNNKTLSIGIFMKNLRILALTSLLAGFGLMTGCDTTSSNNESPTIKDATLDLTTLTAGGGSTTMRGIVADDNSGISLSIKVLSGTTDVSNKFTISFTAIPASEKSWSIGDPAKGNGKITALGTAANGTYTLVYTATDKDGATGSAQVSFTVTGGSTVTTLTEATVILGSNDNTTAGSSLDADALVSYKISEVTTALQGEIDAYYAYSAAAAKDRFFSPAQAKTSLFDGIKNWTVSNSVELYDLGTLTDVAFAAVNNQTAIDALFTGKTAVTSVDAAANVVVGIKTSKGAKRIIRVNSITPGATGTVTVKGYK